MRFNGLRALSRLLPIGCQFGQRFRPLSIVPPRSSAGREVKPCADQKPERSNDDWERLSGRIWVRSSHPNGASSNRQQHDRPSPDHLALPTLAGLLDDHGRRSSIGGVLGRERGIAGRATDLGTLSLWGRVDRSAGWARPVHLKQFPVIVSVKSACL